MSRYQKFENEFFMLAGTFLWSRGSLILGKSLIESGNHNDIGAYLGMSDSAFEMKLLCEEYINAKTSWM